MILFHLSFCQMARRSYFRSYRRYYRPRRSYRRSYPVTRTRRRTGTKRPRRRTVRSKTQCSNVGDLSPGQKFLLAQADPFDPQCQGAKIPDANTVPSVGFPMTELTSLSTVAVGDVRCWGFMPGITNSIVASTGGVASWTWAATFGGFSNWSKRSAVTNVFELSRPVAHGIRISCPNAPTTTTGFVHIAVAYESFNNISTWPWPTDVAGISGYQQYKRVTLASLTQSPLTIINKYTDETAFRYTSPDRTDAPSPGGTQSGSLEFNIPYSWGAILIAVEGAASTSPLVIEQILHSEGIPKSSSFLMGGMAAPYSPSILGATANMVAKTDIAHTEDQQESYISSALGHAYAGASQALGELGSAAGGALRQAVYNGVMGAARLGLGAAAGVVANRGLPGVNANPNRLALTR